MEITSTGLFDRLTEILSRLAAGKKHDPSWMRPMTLTIDERRSDYYEAEAIIKELRERSTPPDSEPRSADPIVETEADQ